MADSDAKPKTYKREVAVALFLSLGALVYADKPEMVSLLVWPITIFGAGAFGLDSVSKQLQSKITS